MYLLIFWKQGCLIYIALLASLISIAISLLRLSQIKSLCERALNTTITMCDILYIFPSE
jgi:hypothetical protein